MNRRVQRRMAMSRQILNRTRRQPIIRDTPVLPETTTGTREEQPRALTDEERDEVIAHDVARLRERKGS